jgi:signal peptidase I
MFSFLYSEQKKMRQNAESWLEVADRVKKFRRDQLTDAQWQQLVSATGEVKSRLAEKADASRIKMSLENLEGVLRTTGGRIYPTSSLVENVEFFLAAAIIILGLRAYVVQPFKIPTNSMWPTYYGMTASELYTEKTEPGLLMRAIRTVGLGASHYSVTAPADGEVMVPIVPAYGLRPVYTDKPGRSLLIFPMMQREYTFMVGGQMTSFSVPAEFDNDFQGVLDEAFKGSARSMGEALRNSANQHKPLQSSTLRVGGRDMTVYWVPVGKRVKRGEKFLSFDVLTGDLLFVERISYNFVAPKVGSGFVFKTENIKSPQMQDEAGNQVKNYYIKRLVGIPGDTLEVRAPALWRNGKPIEGADVFSKNARREGVHPGYTPEGLLSPGSKLTVPENSYFAMGDNSPRSKDGRSWGFVPEKDVVGRPLFIYYPLTTRWGPAR